MFIQCTLIWIWQCNQGPNWTVKLNSAVEHHLTILCQGWKKSLCGGRVGKRKGGKTIVLQHLFVTEAFWAGDREAMLDCAGLGRGCVRAHGLSPCPQNGDGTMFWEGWRVFFATSHRAIGIGGSWFQCLAVMLQYTFSEYNKAERLLISKMKMPGWVLPALHT